MSAYFVTATGTDIGKTYVCSALVRHWRAAARRVHAIKPVASGFDPATPETSDPGILLGALGRSQSLAEIERIAPWRFAAPLSPDMAARREGKAIDFDALVAFCRKAVADNPGMLLIEGVGGVMVPLDDRHTVLDWMQALGLPVILVAGSYLGTISHTLTAVDALKAKGLTVKALIVNETAGSTVPMSDTLATLANFVRGIPIAGLPRTAGPAADPEAVARLAALL